MKIGTICPCGPDGFEYECSRLIKSNMQLYHWRSVCAAKLKMAPMESMSTLTGTAGLPDLNSQYAMIQQDLCDQLFWIHTIDEPGLQALYLSEGHGSICDECEGKFCILCPTAHYICGMSHRQQYSPHDCLMQQVRACSLWVLAQLKDPPMSRTLPFHCSSMLLKPDIGAYGFLHLVYTMPAAAMACNVLQSKSVSGMLLSTGCWPGPYTFLSQLMTGSTRLVHPGCTDV